MLWLLRISFSVILFCIHYNASAQQTSFSEPKKISSKSPQFRILGKNNEGIILHEYGRSENIIEAYNNSMKLKWRKNINIRQLNATIKKIIIYPDTTNIIYVAPDKEQWRIYAQSMDARFGSGIRFLMLDSVNYGKENFAESIKVIHSKNRSKILAYYPEPGQNAINFILLEKNLDVVMKQKVDFALPDGDYSLNDVLVDDEGNILVALLDNAKHRKSDGITDRNRIFIIRKAEMVSTTLDFSFSQPGFGKVKFDIDNINKQIVAGGFFTDEQQRHAKGYFFKAYSIAENKLIKNHYISFSSNLYVEIAGKESGQNLDGLSTFEIIDLVLRYDGGVMMIAESRFNNIESIQTPSFVPAAGPSFRSVTVTYYNDLMVLCVSPTGKEDWVKVLRKKQVSEEDEGFFSSYAMHIRGDEVNLIYNEDIYQSTNVSNYKLDPKGDLKRNTILNSYDQNVLLVPRLGKQVSSNETIIPSFRKNNLRLVKLTF
jgi:hypothetical protein